MKFEKDKRKEQRIEDEDGVTRTVKVDVPTEGALGGEGVLAVIERGLNIISVKNENIINLDNSNFSYPNLIEVENYFEAAGLILAIREGINPQSIRRPLNKIQELIL